MRTVLRITAATAALLVAAGCARDGTSPTTPADDFAAAAAAALDPSIGATDGQASMPGLTMMPGATFDAAAAPSDRCAYSAATGRIVCAAVVRNGLTITRSIAFYDAAGTPQARRDAGTVSANTEVTVKGTTTTERGTFTVDRASTLTISGLGRNAKTHALNGSEHGTSSGTITTRDGAVTVTEAVTSVTKDVVVPVPAGHGVWPLSGTVSRSATLTVARGSGPARTIATTEQVSFTGTSVVNVIITRNGVTRSCTRDLAARTGSCS